MTLQMLLPTFDIVFDGLALMQILQRWTICLGSPKATSSKLLTIYIWMNNVEVGKENVWKWEFEEKLKATRLLKVLHNVGRRGFCLEIIHFLCIL